MSLSAQILSFLLKVSENWASWVLVSGNKERPSVLQQSVALLLDELHLRARFSFGRAEDRAWDWQVHAVFRMKTDDLVERLVAARWASWDTVCHLRCLTCDVEILPGAHLYLNRFYFLVPMWLLHDYLSHLYLFILFIDDVIVLINVILICTSYFLQILHLLSSWRNLLLRLCVSAVTVRF